MTVVYEGLSERVKAICVRLGLSNTDGSASAFAALYTFVAAERDDERDHVASLIETQSHGLHLASKLVEGAEDVGQMALLVESCARTVRRRSIELDDDDEGSGSRS